MKIKKLLILVICIGSIFTSVSAETVTYSSETVSGSSSAIIPNAISTIEETKTVSVDDYERVKTNLENTISWYEEEKTKKEAEELAAQLKAQEEAAAKAKKEAQAKAYQKMQNATFESSNNSVVYTTDIYSLAQSYVGRTGDCFQIATQFLNEYYYSGYTSTGNYQVGDPQPGDLIYYANGGLGTTQYAVYLGNGQALQGNYNGRAVIAGVYLNGASDPIYYRYNG